MWGSQAGVVVVIEGGAVELSTENGVKEAGLSAGIA